MTMQDFRPPVSVEQTAPSKGDGGQRTSPQQDGIRRGHYIAGQGAFATALLEVEQATGLKLGKKIHAEAAKIRHFNLELSKTRRTKAQIHNAMSTIQKRQRQADEDALAAAYDAKETPTLPLNDVEKQTAMLRVLDRGQAALESLLVRAAGNLMDIYADSGYHAKLSKFWDELMAKDMTAPDVTNAEKADHATQQSELARIIMQITPACEQWENAGFTDAEKKKLRDQILELPDVFPTLLDIRNKTYSQRGLVLHEGQEGVEAARQEKADAQRTEQEGMAADSAKARNLTPAAIKAAKELAAKRMASTSIVKLEGTPDDK